ncbi:MAG: iron ABC transporter permease [Clostridia bacterium]|nr:iron ABC transporter permease [Clostridia bacterium]
MQKAEQTERRRLIQDPILFLIIVFVIAILLTFVALPLFRILKGSFTGSDGSFSLESYGKVFADGGFREAFWNTMRLGLVVGVTSTVVGFLFAYTKQCVKSPFKRLYSVIEILPIISPPFVLAFAAITLLGRRGLITYDLLGIKDFNLYGYTGLVIVQTLVFFPIAAMTLDGLLENFDVSMEEAARNLGASRFRVFFTVQIPMLASGLANVFLLSFIESATDFSNPMILGGGYKTLASQIYIQAIGNYNQSAGTAIATVLLLVTISVFVVQKAILDKRSYVTLTGMASRVREMIDDKGIMITTNTLCLIISFIVLLFYVFVILSSFFKTWGADYTLVWDNWEHALGLKKNVKAIFDTVEISLIVAPLGGLLAMIIAFLVVRKRFIGRRLVEYVSMLGMAVPGTVFGLGYILAFNIPPLVLTNTIWILIIVLVMTRLPVGVRSGMSALRQIDPSIEEAASDLGARSTKVFSSITLPLIRPSFYTGLVFSFVKSMTAISAVIFLVSAKYTLLTVRVMQHVDKGQFGYASVLSTLLMIIVFIVVGLMNLILNHLGRSSSEKIDFFKQ